MKKNFMRIMMSLVITAATLLTLSISAFAVGEAHNLYTSPDLSATSGGWDAFMIDFKTDDENSIATYWALANYTLDVKETVKTLKYVGLQNPAGYAGLQVRNSETDRVGIFSCWQYQYTDLKTRELVTLNAKRIYPEGEATFDNEGFGVKCIEPYGWKDHQVYRMLLLCWEDAEAGRTFAGTWFYDYEAKEWTLFAYYNFQLVNSYFVSGFSQFMENFSRSRSGLYRSFNYTNFYVLDHKTKQWVSTPKIHITSDSFDDKVGVVGAGQSDDKVWATGFADGSKVDDKYVGVNKTVVLKQDSAPIFGTPEISDVKGENKNGKTTISWEMTKESTPQLSYNVKVVDSNGKEVFSKYATRPEETSVTIDEITTADYTATLTIKDVFGKEVTREYKGLGTGTAVETKTPETTAPATTAPATAVIEPVTNNTALIIIIAVVAAVIIIGCAAFFIVKKKK